MAPNSQKSRRGEDFDPELLNRFRGTPLSKLKELPGNQWLIEGCIPKDGLAVLYGEPEAGKTLLGLDWALCSATGTPWQGHAVTPGRDFYVYTESTQRLSVRVDAWLAEHGEHLRELANANFLPLLRPVNMLDKREVRHLIQVLREFQPDFIVIDTLVRCFGGGNENSTQDMSQFVDGCEALREAFPGSTALIVHHTGKNEARGARGSNALLGAVSAEFHLVKKSEERRSLKNSKQRDAAKAETLELQLVPVGES
jgi:RecA-family ATPase